MPDGPRSWWAAGLFGFWLAAVIAACGNQPVPPAPAEASPTAAATTPTQALIPDPLSTSEPSPTLSPEPSEFGLNLTADEAARLALRRLDPEREPRIERVMVRSASQVRASWGDWPLGLFQGDQGQLPEDDRPVFLAQVSGRGLHIEAERLLRIMFPEPRPTPRDGPDVCMAPPPDERETIVVVIDGTSGRDLGAELILPRRAKALAELESLPDPDVVERTRTPAPVPTEAPAWQPTPLPYGDDTQPADMAAVPAEVRAALTRLAIEPGRWWRYARASRSQAGSRWDTSDSTLTVGALRISRMGDLRLPVTETISATWPPDPRDERRPREVVERTYWLGFDAAGQPEWLGEWEGSPGFVNLPDLGPVFTFPDKVDPEFRIIDEDYGGLSAVVAHEPITVPAGRFEGCWVDDVSINGTDHNWSWKCPGIGAVRQESFGCSTIGQQNTVTELVATGLSTLP